jgi:hypothetical protein
MSFASILLVVVALTAVDRLDPKRQDQEGLLELGRSIERATAAGDSAALAVLLDRRAFLQGATTGLDVPPSYIDGLDLAMADVPVGTFARMSSRIASGEVSYRFLRVIQRDGEPRLLFRLIEGPYPTYHEHIVGKTSPPRVIDIFTLLTGETMTEAWRRDMQRDEEYFRTRRQPPELAVMHEMQRCLAQGDARGVIRVFEAAPAEVREMKSVALFRLHAAREIAFAELDSKPLEEAVEAWQKLLTPGSPAAAIHAIEPLMLSGEFEKALEAVEVVDRWAGGDPCLDVFRATIYLRAGELDKARERVDRLVTAAGEFSESHYTRMAVALKQGDHPTVLDELRILRDRFGSQLEPSQEPAFAAFVRSPQFRQWQADSAPE